MVKSDSNIVVNYSSIFLGVTLYVCNVLYCTVMVWYGMEWFGMCIYIYIISYLEDHPTTSE